MAAGAYELPGELGIANVAALHEELRTMLDTGQALRLSAGGVVRVDSAAMQLLAACARDLAEQERAIAWESVSPELREAARLLGFGELLAFPEHNN